MAQICVMVNTTSSSAAPLLCCASDAVPGVVAEPQKRLKHLLEEPYHLFICRYVECMPDVGRVQLVPDDSMMIMASDGLWDVLSDQQAVDAAEVQHLYVIKLLSP